MTYTPKLPPRSAILDAWLRAHPFQLSSTPEDREAEFEMWEAEIKAQALEEAAELAEGQDGFEIEIGLANYIGSELRHRAQQLRSKHDHTTRTTRPNASRRTPVLADCVPDTA